MKSKMIILSLLTTWGFLAGAQSTPFVLQGRNLDLTGPDCFLYVDNSGYGAGPRGKNQFYAEVRTSFDPGVTILLTAHPYSRFEMVSLDKLGRPSRDLSVRLRGPANAQTLRQAVAYQGMIRNNEGRPKSRFACSALRPLHEN